MESQPGGIFDINLKMIFDYENMNNKAINKIRRTTIYEAIL
jgi:hypothetical protein